MRLCVRVLQQDNGASPDWRAPVRCGSGTRRSRSRAEEAIWSTNHFFFFFAQRWLCDIQRDTFVVALQLPVSFPVVADVVAVNLTHSWLLLSMPANAARCDPS